MWRPSTNTIASVPCLRHALTKEIAAFGVRGQLFLFADDDVRALIYHDGYEEIRRVPPKQVKSWARRLEIPTDLKAQIALAERADRGLAYE